MRSKEEETKGWYLSDPRHRDTLMAPFTRPDRKDDEWMDR